ncbi:MAG: DUF1648 domain-containing protein [Trichococcus sp.]|uniref:DUF1648 domain-containing protein n=1 Tax=Trichococcus sp. TaxID=1985464 RepID=UPI003C375121
MNPSQRFSIFSVQSSFAILLLPLISGIFSYSYLPDRITIHINELGQADDYLSKLAFLIGLPVAGLFFQLYRVVRWKKNAPTMNVFGGKKTSSSILLFPIFFDIAYFSAVFYNLNI